MRLPDLIRQNVERAVGAVMGGAEGGPGTRFRQGLTDGWGKLRRRLRATWAALGWLDDSYEDEDQRRRRARQLLATDTPSLPGESLAPGASPTAYKAEVDAGRLAANTSSRSSGGVSPRFHSR